MGKYALSLLAQRFVLPIILAACFLFRPVGLSVPYFLLFLYLPHVPVATARSMKGSTGVYLKILIVVAVLLSITQICFQTTLQLLDQNILSQCENLEKIFRHVGLVRLDNLSPFSVVYWVLPEAVMLITSITLFILLRKFSMDRVADVENNTDAQILLDQQNEGNEAKQWTKEKLAVVSNIGVILGMFLIVCVSGFRPSVPGAVYYLIYLGLGTWWAIYKSFVKPFAIVSRIMMFFLCVHMAALLAYQNPWPQEFLDSNSTIARIMGLTEFFTSSCENDTRIVHFDVDYELDYYFNPLAILICYYTLSITSAFLLSPKALLSTLKNRVDSSSVPNERTPLMRSSTKRLKSDKSDRSPAAAPDGVTDIPMEDMETQGPGFMSQVSIGLTSIGNEIYKNSYVFTNITMMTWSIMYHSWMTFVLLIGANILWMIPNKRQAMLKTSPVIVVYAIILLLANYVYSLNLNDDELPTKVDTPGINLIQIGLIRYLSYPLKHILIKSLFTIMFWITFRQMVVENRAKRQRSTLADMVAPLQVTVGAATTDLAPKIEDKKSSALMTRLGAMFNTVLLKTWLWIVILVVFLSGITGSKMTGFRIGYMALFLIFIVVFQISWRAWKKIMWVYWFILIGYAMAILILIYTYQFDKFPTYWKDYLHVSETLQLDIGLAEIGPTVLFLHLVGPTLIVIMTVIQLQYFHKKYIKLLDHTVPNTENSRATDSKKEQDATEMDYDNVEDPTIRTNTEKDKKTMWEKVKSISMGQFKQYVVNGWEFGWLFLEMHLIKLCLVISFFICVRNPCFLHILFAVLTIIAAAMPTRFQIFASRLLSTFTAIIFLANMIYQVDYIEHSNYDANCTNSSTFPKDFNNAKWFGFEKETNGLASLLKGYIWYLIVVTIHAVVVFRQTLKRLEAGQSPKRPPVLFQNITFKNCERDMVYMLKYLLNYGFYRFGIEISLIAMVILIASRLDFIAFFYAIWVLVVYSMSREQKSRIWRCLITFNIIMLIYQYVMIVGLPPGLCYEYPWNTSLLQHIQELGMLPDYDLKLQITKLYFDFILLFFLARQQLVFDIENRIRTNETEYPGGSNQSIVEAVGNQSFSQIQNPTPDFTTYVRNWLDVIKCFVLLGFFWYTLAIVFLTGTNRVNIFSLGYLFGSFVFLWQGSDFYLRPISVIIQRWNMLVKYNLIVILIKTIMQLTGCLFYEPIANISCSLIQILGITCINRTGMKFKIDFHICDTPHDDEAGLFWDVICFSFLLLQLRIFKSYYFCHVVNDTKASNMLASRGAQLIEVYRAKQMKIQTEHENEILDKIKMKMDRIKEVQKKYSQVKEPRTHAGAIRSGDYHMFQDVNYDVDLNMFRERKDGDDVDESDRRMKKKMKLSEKKQRRREASEFETDETIQQDGQQPSTSRGGDSGRDHSPDIKSLPKDDDDIQPEEEAKMKALRGFMFIIRFVESAIISLALKLDKVSRNYRYVRKILTKEKKQLKESEGFHMGLRISSALIWGQHPGNEEDTIVANDDKLANDETATISSGSVSLDVVDSPRKSFGSSYTRDVTEREQLEKGPSHVPESEEFGQQEHSAIVELLRSIWFLFLSHTDLICYFMVLLNQVFSASLLSLPLPLMVFFWGTLTIPRPSKTFWITMIAYTQTVVLLKCASQFDLLWWNQNQIPDNQPLAPARIFGLEKKPGYATFDLALLLVIFFHRYMLKSMGLWKTEFKDELLPDGTYKTQNGTQTNEDVKSPVPLAIKNKDDEEQAAIITDGKTALILKPYDKEGTPEPEEGYVQVTTTEEEPSNFFPQGIQMAIKKYTSATKIFFASLLGPTSRPKRDVYAYMFMCDFINFLVLLFGFTSFGSSQTDGDDGVTSYLSENKVPILFLVMLLLQFVLIIIDRALYLRKYILGKLVFQYILIVFIHIWMFLILPGVTERRFNARRPPVIFYLVKCVYLLFAAFQIRCGYPSRILGNMLTKGYGMINLMLHHVFMGIPFLYELRTVMDWIWTDTTMTLFDWLKMEDIFVNIFRLKCGRQMESEYPAPAGTKKKTISKYMMGGLTLIILIVAIWFPLAIFALSNTVGEPNPPFDVTVSLRLGPYQPVYEMSAQDSSIISFKANDFFSMQKQYLKSRKAVTFLAGYEAEDVTAILLAANSRSVWGISQPDKARLLEDVRGNSTITCRFKYSVSRLTHNKDNPGIITDERVYELKVNDPYRSTLAEMLESEVTIDKPVWLPFMFPKFLKVKNQGSLDASDALLTDPDNDITDNVYRNLSLKLFHSVEAEDKTVWWEVKETCDSDARKTALGILPYNDCVNSMVMYLFNDRLFPATLSFLTAGGIIGMYTTFIIFISRFIRGFMSGSSKSIMFEDLPYVDRVLQLCLDIYLVREALEFVLEEDLFARLIFLYRSPELMIKWTRDPDGSTVVEAIEDRPQNVPRDDPRDDDTLAPSDGLRQRR